MGTLSKITEHDTQKLILEYLAVKNIFCWRNNSGARIVPKKGGGNYFFRYGAVGSPDIFAIRAGLCYGIEVKSPIGKQSDSQKKFEDAFMRAGGIYILAKTLEDVQKWL